MKRAITLAVILLFSSPLISQTTIYSTGVTFNDDWTGWTVESSSPNVDPPTYTGNHAWEFQFNGANGEPYNFKVTRNFSFTDNPLDLYLTATTQSCLISFEYSTDGTNYTVIANDSWGAYAEQTMSLVGYTSAQSNFFIRIKVEGVIGSPSKMQLKSFWMNSAPSNSVSIAPTATQNILVGANGTTLTATESPAAADSREWKYSTVSGSGYVSFAPAQTGLTYTPNFGGAGTYYVICQSVFGGVPETSNEVIINVTTAGDVNELTTTNQLVFYNNFLRVKEPQGDYEVKIYDITGKVIYSEKNLIEYNTAHFIRGVYFVSIQTGEGLRKTIKIFAGE
ncbi:MAG: T9SS type A sorting domain-containing protein [Crocinitomicaceae bacterium]|nr:T9SS type A sorting domain-containing protein [Crocinitomicaceae bacterium]